MQSSSTDAGGRPGSVGSESGGAGPSSRHGAPSVLVLGAGPAGLTAALALARAGCAVTVLEKSDQVGGRTRAWHTAQGIPAGTWGLGVAGWQVHVRQMLETLGQEGSLVSLPPAAVFSRERRLTRLEHLELPSPMRRLGLEISFVRGFSTQEKLSTRLLALALASFERGRLDELDELSLRAWGIGFSASHHPFLRHLLDPYTLLLMLGPWHNLSARTAACVMRRWASNQTPVWSRFAQGPQEGLILPMLRELERHGGRVVTEVPVTALLTSRARLDAVVAGEKRWTADYVVSALPPLALRHLLTPALLQYHYFRDLSLLKTAPIASLILLTRPGFLPGLEPVVFSDSELGMFVQGLSAGPMDAGSPALYCVLTHYEAFAGLSDEALLEMVLRELRVLFPALSPAHVVGHTLTRHDDSPGILNGTGSWRHRPWTRSPLRNFVLAGEWVRTPGDLACLEGAVVSGLQAARVILEDRGQTVPALEPSEPSVSVRVAGRLASVLDAPRRAARQGLLRTDRRRYPRSELALEGYLEDRESQVGWTPILVVNLARTGVYIVSDASPRVRARIRLRLGAEADTILELRGRVVRVEDGLHHPDGGYGIGCRIEAENDETERRLLQLLPSDAWASSHWT